MQKISSTFTVYFENPFWVGVYERLENGYLTVSKTTFGSEPKDYEVHQFLLDNWDNLKFSKPIKAKELTQQKINPKRMQREINKSLSRQGVGTKSQQAIKEQQERSKLARKKNRADKKAEFEQYKFEKRQEKRKRKRKGR